MKEQCGEKRELSLAQLQAVEQARIAHEESGSLVMLFATEYDANMYWQKMHGFYDLLWQGKNLEALREEQIHDIHEAANIAQTGGSKKSLAMVTDRYLYRQQRYLGGFSQQSQQEDRVSHARAVHFTVNNTLSTAGVRR